MHLPLLRSPLGEKPLNQRIALVVAVAVFVTSSSWAGDAAPRAVVGEAVVAEIALRGAAAVVIVYRGQPGRALARSIGDALPRGHFAPRHHFRGISALSGTITARGLEALLRDPRVVRVGLEEGGAGSLAEVVPLVGLDFVQGMGFGGEGVTVALLDTGADLDHDDLVDSIVAEACFCSGCCPNGMDTQTGPGSAEDDHGHGTNVAGVITSNGTVSFVGGAPDADLVLVKVLDSSNVFCCSSDVLAGLDWIIVERPEVDVVNLSLGTDTLYAGDCDAASATTLAYAAAVDTLRARGVLVFAASGNNGSTNQMAAPACVAGVVAVAASDDADAVFSSANTNASTALLAPGVNIDSTGPANGTLSLTGTSQASAMASACAATLLGARPAAQADDVEAALLASTTVLVDPKNNEMIPRLDCLEALPEPGAAHLAVAACATLLALSRRSRRLLP